MPIITALWRLREEDHHKFQASLDYRVRLCLKKQNKKIENLTHQDIVTNNTPFT